MLALPNIVIKQKNVNQKISINKVYKLSHQAETELTFELLDAGSHTVRNMCFISSEPYIL